MRSKAVSVSWREGVLAGLLGTLVLLAWWSLWLWGKSPYGHLLMHSAHAGAGMFVFGWTLMTVAMMLPTVIPLLLFFHRMVQERAWASGLIALVIAGYLSVWTLFGVLVLCVSRLLQAGIRQTPFLADAPWIPGAAILLLAGLYQFSRVKYACLDRCRSPLAFVASRRLAGNESWQSLRLGVEHGLFCLGCCWSLMLLMLVIGAGSLGWMLLLGVVMAIEKNLRWGRRLSAPVGVILLLGAAVVLVTGLTGVA